MECVSSSNYQTVTLIGSDGKKYAYHGEVQIDPEFPPKVVDIAVSQPKPLPPGASWAEEVSPEHQTGKTDVQKAVEKGFNGG
jgi:hypothetical protein